ncbi:MULTISPECIES: YozE family protein [unclassified Granulicatella]|uniref:YozE family protein n=1 Tax=unclassified Granulicatella TaxID=2630493 RepID=UPI0013D8DC03|nr:MULTISPECIES: YozE family protein [unclassified Granulicatella]QMI86364.1 YozE family protein [Carnobacteriaceae bacterium zg-84]
MYRSFYQFMLTYADPYKKDKQTAFANVVSNDIGFPKHAEDYDTIVNYVELTDLYSNYLTIFDELWETYMQRNQMI